MDIRRRLVLFFLGTVGFRYVLGVYFLFFIVYRIRLELCVFLLDVYGLFKELDFFWRRVLFFERGIVFLNIGFEFY